MTIIIGFILGGVALIAYASLVGPRNHDWLDMWPAHCWAAMAAGITFIVVGGGLAIAVPVSYSYDETVCARYGVETGRDTRIARYGLLSWDCLVETDEGWVDQSQIIKVDD